ncbi:MAG TPA: carboxypeptidase regulatory-like domain-containing protein [Vicinamibacterales bacterium]|nr:carboxypeptidase regulatory-like domain-containing protein [Vicinamibacterales bacterium]
MKRRIALLVVLTVAVALAPGLSAYLRFGVQVGNRVILLKWAQMPVRYFITNRDVPGVTAPQLQTAVASAFSAWSNVPTAQLSAQFGGFVSADPGNSDGVTVIGFLARPDLDRVLGATTHSIDNVTGAIVESDIFLNTKRDATTPLDWSVAANGETGRFDVQSISTHEIGHLLGLGHSALGETELLANTNGGRRILGKNAVMFPIAFPAGNIADRVLKPDDIAGMAGIYPTSAFTGSLGSISGRVTLNNAGLFGAHVTAFNPSTGALVGAFTLDQQGTFTIDGLPPGVYALRVEPLDDGDIDSFFDPDAPVNINFKAAYYSKLVAVPAGGAGPAIEIRVQSK